MKGKVVFAIVAFLLLISSFVYSEEGEGIFGNLFEFSGEFAIAGNISAAVPKEEDSDATVFLGGYLSYDILKCLGVGLESGWAQWDVKDSGVDFGDIAAFPLLGNLYLKLPIGEEKFKIVPYGVIGMGVIFWAFDESSTLSDAGVSIDVDPSFAMKFGGGADIFFTENVALFGEASFIWTDTTLNASGGTLTTSATADTDTWIIGGGIKYVF